MSARLDFMCSPLLSEAYRHIDALATSVSTTYQPLEAVLSRPEHYLDSYIQAQNRLIHGYTLEARYATIINPLKTASNAPEPL